MAFPFFLSTLDMKTKDRRVFLDDIHDNLPHFGGFIQK